MSFKRSVFVFLFLFFIVKATDKVKLSVYYETLCPDSIEFINNQLYPNYEAFGPDFVELELIPYGFAKEIDANNSKVFICQHGPKECYGNEVHGCAIASVPIYESMKFIYCSESSTPPTSEKNLQACAKNIGLSWSVIKECLTNGQAEDIMSENRQKTQNLNPSFIPSVTFNGIFNIDDQNQSRNDLKSVICKYLDNKPQQCSSDDEIYVIML